MVEKHILFSSMDLIIFVDLFLLGSKSRTFTPFYFCYVLKREYKRFDGIQKFNS